MNYKPLIIVMGEPYSIFSEILFKLYKTKIIKKFKRPIVLIGSKDLLNKQMLKMKYHLKINEIRISDLNKIKTYNKTINIIDIKFKFKNVFDKISVKSNNYIKECFNTAILLLKKKNAFAMINGPISKKHFLNKKYLGITEYLSSNLKMQYNGVMLIYNPSFSVCPLTTHMPINRVSRNISTKKIIYNVIEIDKFFKKKLQKKPLVAVLGLNPHCETINKFSEENKFIKPAIKYLIKKKIKVSGPFSSDTFFNENNLKKYDVAVGMYHDQVLTPMKTLYNFNAINITLGLPFIRISPDHGPNNQMIGKNKSDPQSLISSINFLKKFK